ncbi:MAG: hypothetical protein ACXADO_06440 [Candidatus Thorarchaeota archaeon]|jgi:hypothetical protein
MRKIFSKRAITAALTLTLIVMGAVALAGAALLLCACSAEKIITPTVGPI